MKELDNALVTGGCGFIGSHIVDELIKRHYFVTVIDDLSAGTNLNYLQPYIASNKADFFKYDIRNYEEIIKIDRDYKCMFHYAAQPDVKISVNNPRYDFEVNIDGTFNILELARLKDIQQIVFASSAGTIYGEPDVFPTPENYPLRPISNYGAAKAAMEMYCSSYSSLYGLSIVSTRLGNVFGPRSTHGVMYDFYHKLMVNPNKLTILGDGNQTKSYLYIDEVIDATMILFKKMKKDYEVYNVNSEEPITVTEIASEMCSVLGLNEVRFEYTGGKRGWKGDVVYMSSDTSKLKEEGWKPTINTKEGIQRYIEWLKGK